MAINENKVRNHLEMKAKLDGLPVEVINADDFLNDCIDLGGSEFWTADWEFAKVHDTFSLVVGESDYQLNLATTLDVAADSVYSIKRQTSDDKGKDLKILTEGEFDELYPYPEAYSNGNPRKCKVYKKSGDLWLCVFRPPDATDTVEVAYRLDWSRKMMARIPDELFGVFCLYCRAYMVSEERQFGAFATADKRRDKMLNRINRAVRKRLTVKPLPFGAFDNRGDSWDALNIE